ncbi:hypothetical protein BOC40_06660 [Burkholderia pseudomallei]|uniref:hypothetical protein n=1 Tax=Burkholderia pseudomallei TaxID=28450 RepID=UPI000A1A14C4|nr:hypothetical protein [Burkholderia pseudomallei]ARK80138.1 hypothetical protein BOC40_06660 [Burkholderia pseudomallei]ARL46275.1 hypothetical protein BOC50_25240 [Burkholderia pseudomallei]
MLSVLEEAAQKVRKAPTRWGVFGLMSFEHLLDAVREQGAPVGRQEEVLEIMVSKHKKLLKEFDLPTDGFKGIASIEEKDWLYVKLKLALLLAATASVAASENE